MSLIDHNERLLYLKFILCYSKSGIVTARSEYASYLFNSKCPIVPNFGMNIDLDVVNNSEFDFQP